MGEAFLEVRWRYAEVRRRYAGGTPEVRRRYIGGTTQQCTSGVPPEYIRRTSSVPPAYLRVPPAYLQKILEKLVLMDEGLQKLPLQVSDRALTYVEDVLGKFYVRFHFTLSGRQICNLRPPKLGVWRLVT